MSAAAIVLLVGLVGLVVSVLAWFFSARKLRADWRALKERR